MTSTPAPSEGTDQQSQKSRKRRQLSEKQLGELLPDHWVMSKPSDDHDMRDYLVDIVKVFSPPAVLPTDAVDIYMERLWQFDMAKCFRSNEIIFQHTIMLAIIARLELDAVLDYNCEATWTSDRYPCHNCVPRKCSIAPPRPDLAVSFKSAALWPDNDLAAQVRDLDELTFHLFAEGKAMDNDERVFHFFTVEAKGKRGSMSNEMAQYQNLNSASQALYNIYRCMKLVDDLDRFFREVRVFSLVATARAFELRVHRGEPLAADGKVNDRRYPIKFAFQEVCSMGQDYSRQEATRIVHNILIDYGVKKLFPIMKETVEKLCKIEIPRIGSPLPSLPPPSDPGRNFQSPPRKRRAAGTADSLQSSRSSQRRRYSNDPSTYDFEGGTS